MIWKLVLIVPQTHIMEKKAVSCSKINAVMESYRAARNLGLAQELSYFRVSGTKKQGRLPKIASITMLISSRLLIGTSPGTLPFFQLPWTSSCRTRHLPDNREAGLAGLQAWTWAWRTRDQLWELERSYSARRRRWRGMVEAMLNGRRVALWKCARGIDCAASNRHRDIHFAEPSIGPWRILPDRVQSTPMIEPIYRGKRWRKTEWLRRSWSRMLARS